MPGPSVFISYAREDEIHRAELRKHLQPWEDADRLRIWDDHAIDAPVATMRSRSNARSLRSSAKCAKTDCKPAIS